MAIYGNCSHAKISDICLCRLRVTTCIFFIYKSAPHVYTKTTLYANASAEICVCYLGLYVCVLVDLLPTHLGQLDGAEQKGLVKSTSSSCNPKGYSLPTDTCSKLTEHFLHQNMFTLHLADTLYPE